MVTILYSAGLRLGEVCTPRYEDVERKHMRITSGTPRTALTDMPSSQNRLLISLRITGSHAEGLWGCFSLPQHNRMLIIIRLPSPNKFVAYRRKFGWKKDLVLCFPQQSDEIQKPEADL